MARPTFRARSLRTASLLALPTLALLAACGQQQSNAPTETVHNNFGDGSTTPGHDATVDHAAPPVVDSGHDGALLNEGGEGGRDGASPDARSDAPTVDDAGVGTPCVSAAECSSGVCAGLPDAAKPAADAGPPCSTLTDGCTCQAASCTDGVKNGDETAVDCGGSCGKCADEKTCIKGTDCVSGECGVGNAGSPCPGGATSPGCTCQPPSCTDGVKNGTETAADCGSSGTCPTGETCPTCGGCVTADPCSKNSDCASSNCVTGTTTSTCGCPAGMALVQTSALGPYCIDSYEVTFAQYQTFTLAGVLVTSQPAECSGNTSFIPTATSPATHPVTNVNWCDAYAYCSWAGKHLCGSIKDSFTGRQAGTAITIPGHADGGTVDAATSDAGVVPTNDPTVDEWYNACSAQGVYAYPYGSTFNPLLCNGSDSPAQSSSGPVEVPPGTLGNVVQTGSAGSCINDTRCGGNVGPTVAAGETVSCYVNGADAGTTTEAGVPTAKCGQAFQESACVEGDAPNLFDMSGNVAEWENACTGSTGGTDLCAVRGGAYDTTPASASLTCATNTAQPALPRDMAYPDVGFRCCL